MSAEADLLVKRAISYLIVQAKQVLAQGGVRALSQAGINALRPLLSAERLKADNQQRTEQMFKRLGASAQASVLEAYQGMIVSEEGPASKTHYRAGRGRLAGGIMRAALAREDFYSASGSGLDIINQEALDGAARQWKRLAFGAGGRGTGSAGAVSFHLGNSDFSFNLNQPARSPFSMPAGLFFGSSGKAVPFSAGQRGRDVFGPSRRSGEEWFPTEGIKGRDFLTAGLRRLAEDLPPAVQELMDGIIASWTDTLEKGEITTVEQGP
jgi:hypothetical protein